MSDIPESESRMSRPGSQPAGGRGIADERSYLRFLVESAEDLNSTLELNQVFRRVARRIKPLVDFHLFCVLLWNDEEGLLEHSFSTCYDEHVPQQGGFPLNHGIGGSCAALRKSIRVPDVSKDSRYVRYRHPEVKIRSELAVPLVVNDGLIGVIDLESTELDAFTEDHEQMLLALASHAAIALENARLHSQVLRHEQRMKHELNMARQIQKGLLPGRPPHIEGLDVGLAYAPVAVLGGDVYDFVHSGDGRVAVAVGDVAGKATPAALYGSLAVGILRGNSIGRRLEPVDLLRRVNTGLVQTAIDNRYIAMSLCVYETATGSLSLASAGFPEPILSRGGEAHKIDVRGLPLGIQADTDYDARQIELRPGDMVAFCSDGLGECVNEAGQELGHDRLVAELATLGDRGAQETADYLLELTDRHVGTRRHLDDRTVVVLKKTASG
jgi:sigma-B regulation protein RsbU (phosphoserine phosphatase)